MSDSLLGPHKIIFNPITGNPICSYCGNLPPIGDESCQSNLVQRSTDIVKKIVDENILVVKEIGKKLDENKLVFEQIQKESDVVMQTENHNKSVFKRMLNNSGRKNERLLDLVSLGLKVIDQLKIYSRDKRFSSIIGSACLLDEEEINSMSELSDDHDLVMKLQTKLASVFPDFAVVNSELFPWIDGDWNDQSPDLFICPIPFYTKKIPHNTVNYPSNYRYGIVDDVCLYKSVVLIDANVPLTSAVFGKLVKHLEHLSAHCDGKPARGMLIGKHEFWLYEHIDNIPLQRIVEVTPMRDHLT